jgi:hypothetical protein
VATSGETFTPAAIAVKVGDTVSITGLTTHPTMSDVFPAGAAKIAMTTTDINYKVTAPGKYTYFCVAHAGMKGSFTATGAAAPGGAAAPAGTAADVPAGQVTDIPVGGVQTGGGSTAGVTHSGLITLGGGLLMAAFMSLVFSRRFASEK